MKKFKTSTIISIVAILAIVGMIIAAAVASGGQEGGLYATAWALFPPVVAIGLALITKEVYSSLFVGILVGALFHTGFQFEATVMHIFTNGFQGVLTSGYNVGILIFLVLLGAIVAMMNKAGGSGQCRGRFRCVRPLGKGAC